MRLLYSNDILEHCLVVNQSNYMATAKGCWLLMQNTHANVDTTEPVAIKHYAKHCCRRQWILDAYIVDRYA